MLPIASTTMKPGDRVVWLRSSGRSLLTGWRVTWIPGVVVRVSRHRIRIRAWQCGGQRLVNVDPDNVLCGEEAICRINDHHVSA